MRRADKLAKERGLVNPILEQRPGRGIREIPLIRLTDDDSGLQAPGPTPILRRAARDEKSRRIPLLPARFHTPPGLWLPHLPGAA